MHNKLDLLNQQALNKGNPRRRRLAMIAAGIGFGSVFAYLLSRLLGSAEPLSSYGKTRARIQVGVVTLLLNALALFQARQRAGRL